MLARACAVPLAGVTDRGGGVLARACAMPLTGVSDRGGGVLARTCATPPAGVSDRGTVLGREGTSLSPLAVPSGGLRNLEDGGGGGVDCMPPAGESDRGGRVDAGIGSLDKAGVPLAGVCLRGGKIAGVVTVGGTGLVLATGKPLAVIEGCLDSGALAGFEASSGPAVKTGPGPLSSSASLPQSESMSSVGGIMDCSAVCPDADAVDVRSVDVASGASTTGAAAEFASEVWRLRALGLVSFLLIAVAAPS